MKNSASASLVLALVCAGLGRANAAPLALQDPGFEETGRTFSPDEEKPNANGFSGSGTLARGWEDNSTWTGTRVSYALDGNNAHGGQFCQRVEIKQVGAAAQLVQTARVQKGHVYRFAIWLRSASSAQLNLSIRQGGAPYQTFGETGAALSPEWKRFSILGAADQDADVFLMLRATSPLTYWADDASFEDLTGAVSDAPPRTGDLLGGASFEAGVPFGWNARVEGDPETVWRDLHLLSVRAADAPEGASIGQFPIAANEGGSISLPVVPLRFGVPHTFSIWMRASSDNTPVSMELDGSTLHSYPVAGKKWQRFTWTFSPPLLDSYRMRLVFSAQPDAGERTIFLDGAQLNEGTTPLAEKDPRSALEMTLDTQRPGHIFFPGEKALAQVHIAPAPPVGAVISLSVEDVNGKIIALPSQPALSGIFYGLGNLGKRGVIPSSSIPLPFEQKQGIWKLRAQVRSQAGQNLSAPVEMVWMRLPRPKELANPADSFFGVHIPFSPSYIQVARDLGLRWVRLHDASMIGKWPVAEPQAGHFEFYDKEVDAAHAAGLQILGMFDGAPARVSTKPREGGYWGIWNIPDKPDALPQWRNYVATLAGHYRGRIDAWEVWNEPWGQWWISSGNPNATPALYAQLLEIANEEAHRVNPQSIVLGVDTYGGSEDNWTKPVLARSGTKSFDALSFHDYADALAGGQPTRETKQANVLRDLQRAEGDVKPLWNTEGGPGTIGSFYAPKTGGLPFSGQATYMVRYDVSSMAAGVKHFFVYSIASGTAMGDPNFHALEHDFAPRPLLAARAVLASLVDGRGTPTLLNMSPDVTCYVFKPAANERGGREVRVLWSQYPDKSAALTIPRGFVALDVWGNPIGAAGNRVTVSAEPIYLRAK